MIKASLIDLIAHRRLGPFSIGEKNSVVVQLIDRAQESWTFTINDPPEVSDSWVAGWYDFGNIDIMCGGRSFDEMVIDLITVRPGEELSEIDLPPIFDLDSHGIMKGASDQDVLARLSQFNPVFDRQIGSMRAYRMAESTLAVFYARYDDDFEEMDEHFLYQIETK